MTSNRVPVLVVLVLLVVASSTIFIPQAGLQAQSLTLPQLYEVAIPIPTTNVGPLAPLVVKPGSCSIVELRNEYASTSIKQAYVWTVKSAEDGNLRLLNYTVGVENVDSRRLKLCLPGTAEPGLYDLVLVDSSLGELRIPRSIWVYQDVPRKISVAIMSDLHFGVVGETDLWRIAAALIASSVNPVFIVWAGDIQDTDYEQYARLAQAYRYALLYNYPVLGVAGNHDNPAAQYTRFLGPTRWVRIIADKILVVGFYTNPYLQQNNIVTWNEIAFLEEALSNYSYIPIKILVTHYPMFYCTGNCTVVASYDDEEVLKPYAPGVVTPVSSYWSVNMTAFRYVLKLIEDYNVTAVFSGHIHTDQYIVYISRRTNTTTHFVTTTSSGQTSGTYPGVRVVDLDLETGVLTIRSHPGVGINSIPVKYSSIGVDAKIVQGRLAITLSIKNSIPWLTLSANKSILVLPWISELNRWNVLVQELSSGSTFEVRNGVIVGNWLYTSLTMLLNPGSHATVTFYVQPDELPPTISIYKLLPEVPRLNRTLTAYINIIDEAWGVDPSTVKLTSNCTISITNVVPRTYMQILDKISIEVRMSVSSPALVACIVEISAEDAAAHMSHKKYVIRFYPPSITPAEPVVVELAETVEQPTTTTTAVTTTATSTSIIETEVTAVTQTEITTTAQATQVTTLPTATSTTTTPASTTSAAVKTPSTTPRSTQETPVGQAISTLTIALVALVVTIVIVLAILLLLRHRK